MSTAQLIKGKTKDRISESFYIDTSEVTHQMREEKRSRDSQYQPSQRKSDVHAIQQHAADATTTISQISIACVILVTITTETGKPKQRSKIG